MCEHAAQRRREVLAARRTANKQHQAGMLRLLALALLLPLEQLLLVRMGGSRRCPAGIRQRLACRCGGGPAVCSAHLASACAAVARHNQQKRVGNFQEADALFGAAAAAAAACCHRQRLQ
eukprot:46849-Chlamydomonas_euryale.AAC.1